MKTLITVKKWANGKVAFVHNDKVLSTMTESRWDGTRSKKSAIIEKLAKKYVPQTEYWGWNGYLP